MNSRAQNLVEQVVQAHGGHHLWNDHTSVRVRFAAGGLAFRCKGEPHTLSDVTADLSTTGQSVTLHGRRPTPWAATLEAGTVTTPDGRRAEYANLARGHRRARWDHLDVAAFTGAALWTYISIPFVLSRPEFLVDVLEPVGSGDHRLERLRVRFPQTVATHSRTQIFYIDPIGRLVRHDYTAEAFGHWAWAAHFTEGYESFGPITLPTRRRVVPRLGQRPLPGPQLVWIAISSVHLST